MKNGIARKMTRFIVCILLCSLCVSPAGASASDAEMNGGGVEGTVYAALTGDQCALTGIRIQKEKVG